MSVPLFPPFAAVMPITAPVINTGYDREPPVSCGALMVPCRCIALLLIISQHLLRERRADRPSIVHATMSKPAPPVRTLGNSANRAFPLPWSQTMLNFYT
jgi:hypothetical protein